MKKKLTVLLLVALIQGCGETQARAPEVGEGPVDQWKAELIQADEVFSETIGREGLSRWGSFFTSDGAVVQEGVGEIRGADAIQASMDAGSGALVSFSWAPERAEVSTAGDLGYTVGRYQTVLMGPEGEELVGTGVYVSIWRRQADGAWKVEMDLGNPITRPEPSSPQG